MISPDKRQALARLVFRLLLSSIFIGAGLQHLLAPGKVAARLSHAPQAALALRLGEPATLVVLAGIALLSGGLALAGGLFTRWAAVGLALVLVPITLTVQVGNPEGFGPLLKNVAILGGLLEVWFAGAGAWSLDAVLSARGKRRAALVAAQIALAIGGFGARAAFASAPAAKAEHKVVLVVQQPPQLAAALRTEQEMLAGKGFPASAAEVVVCGPAAQNLVAGDAMEPQLLAARAKGVRIVACGLTLEEKKIDPARLSPAAEVVPNGFIEALQRQAEGWMSVEL